MVTLPHGKKVIFIDELPCDIETKVRVFETKSRTNKSVRVVMITSYGLVNNQYSNEILYQLTMDDLFR